jgi:hypothetical protein
VVGRGAAITAASLRAAAGAGAPAPSAPGARAGIALHKLARIYERRGEAAEAARCYEENLARIDAERLAGSDTLDALLFLAAYKKARAAAPPRRAAPTGVVYRVYGTWTLGTG